MAGTLLQTVPKIIDGLLLLESFEAANFVDNEGWLTLNGAPTNSSDTAFDGVKSFELDLTFPQIQKTFTAFGWSAAYFQDDPAVVLGVFDPFVIWQTSLGNIFGLGVNLATSTGMYTKIVNGVLTSSGVARSVGWKRLTFKETTTTFDLAINGTVVSSTAKAGLGTPTKIKVGCRTYAGATAFGYFDLVQVTRGPLITVGGLADPQKVTARKADGTLVASALSTAGTATLDVTAIDQPFDGYLVITKQDQVSHFYSTFPGSISAGDGDRLCLYNFGRRPGSLDVKPETSRNDRESTVGFNQTVFYFDRDRVMVMFSDLTDEQKDGLFEWWQYAKQGQVFGLAIDAGATYYAKLTAPTVGISATSVTVDNAASAAKGQIISIKGATGRNREIKPLSAAAFTVAPAGTLTFASVLCAPFFTGDEVRDKFYWPFLLTTDKNLSVSLANLRVKRWNVSITAKEAIKETSL